MSRAFVKESDDEMVLARLFDLASPQLCDRRRDGGD
jgi:hypothetical protein